jgi:hypothetical protein
MISESQFNRLCYLASEFEKLARKAGLIGGQISQASAYRQFGRTRVERWVKQGRINPVNQNRHIYYSFDDLTRLSSLYEYKIQEL